MRIKILSLLILISVCALKANAQKTIIILKDSARVATEIQTIKNDLLIVSEGALSLPLIHAVQFSDSTAVVGKQALLSELIENKILVYINNKLITVQKKEEPLEVVSDTTKTTNQNIIKKDSAVVKKSAPQKPVKKEEPVEDIYEDDTKYLFTGGLGLGIDYGGIGTRLTLSFLKKEVQPALFVGLGYALSGFGVNAGTLIRFLPTEKVSPTFVALWGYNSAIKVFGASQYDKLYYGASIGVGAEVKVRDNENLLHFELIVPFRSSAFHDDLNALKSNPQIEIDDPAIFQISIGYHFKM